MPQHNQERQQARSQGLIQTPKLPRRAGYPPAHRAHQGRTCKKGSVFCVGALPRKSARQSHSATILRSWMGTEPQWRMERSHYWW